MISTRGGISQQIRIVKPLDIYFTPGRPSLNSQGLAHYRSFVLIKLGLLDKQVNTWRKMPKHREHPLVRRAATCAWLLARDGVGPDSNSTSSSGMSGSRAPHNTPNTTDSDDNKSVVVGQAVLQKIPAVRGKKCRRCPGDDRHLKD